MTSRSGLRTGSVVAVVVAVLVALLWGNARFSSATASARAPVGPLAWPFQGSTTVAAKLQADAERSFGPAVRDYVLNARQHGSPLFQVGHPHPLFAFHYLTRPMDVMVLVAPVSDGGSVIGLAGLYGSDFRHHGTDAVVPFTSIDQEVSGNVMAYNHVNVDLLTIVVGGPRAGGLLVNQDGVRQNVGDLLGFAISVDRRGITWMYSSVPRTRALPKDGDLTVTDGNGNLTNVLYYGPIGGGAQVYG